MGLESRRLWPPAEDRFMGKITAPGSEAHCIFLPLQQRIFQAKDALGDLAPLFYFFQLTGRGVGHVPVRPAMDHKQNSPRCCPFLCHTKPMPGLRGASASFQENLEIRSLALSKEEKTHCFPKGLGALEAGRGGKGQQEIPVSKKLSSLASGQGLFMWISSLRQETLGCWKSL